MNESSRSTSSRRENLVGIVRAWAFCQCRLGVRYRGREQSSRRSDGLGSPGGVGPGRYGSLYKGAAGRPFWGAGGGQLGAPEPDWCPSEAGAKRQGSARRSFPQDRGPATGGHAGGCGHSVRVRKQGEAVVAITSLGRCRGAASEQAGTERENPRCHRTSVSQRPLGWQGHDAGVASDEGLPGYPVLPAGRVVGLRRRPGCTSWSTLRVPGSIAAVPKVNLRASQAGSVGRSGSPADSDCSRPHLMARCSAAIGGGVSQFKPESGGLDRPPHF